MVAHSESVTMTVQDYLALEESSQVKHEYVHGHVYAMSGGTIVHDIIANNVRAIIRDHLRGGSCRLLGPDVRLRVSPTVYYYPDAIVICDDTLDLTDIEVRTPRSIVEVLSGSTEAHDRGGKFADYQTLNEFDEYVLVDSQRRGVERFRRAGGRGLWMYQRHEPDASVTIETIGLTCAVAAFYEGTAL